MKQVLLLAAALIAASGHWAQAAYPSKPLKFLVPFNAGSGTDMIARTVADTMGKSRGRPIVIENKPGAVGDVAAGQVARGEAVPTTVEAGVAVSDDTFGVGMIVASNTPAPAFKRLHEEAIKAIASPDVKERLNKLGAGPFPMTPDGFNAFIQTEVEAAALIAKAANLKGQ